MKHLENISAKVNNTFSFDSTSIDELDFTPIDDRHFHILANGKSYRAELVTQDFRRKQFTIKINGSRYDIQLADAYDQMVDRLGLSAQKAQGAQDIKAPMPGLVLQIMVANGDKVTAGQPIIILEAMKMENVIKAATDGQVVNIEVEEGNAVDKGQLLIKMAEHE